MQVAAAVASLHRVSGLAGDPAAGRVSLIERPDLRASIGPNTDDICPDLDVSRAGATLLLRGVFHALTPDFDQGLTAELLAIRNGRRKASRNQLVLLVETPEMVNVDLSTPHHESHGMVVGFDMIDQATLLPRHHQAVQYVLQAVSLSTGQRIDTEKLSQGVFARGADQKLYLSYTITANAASVLIAGKPDLSKVEQNVAEFEHRPDLLPLIRLTADAAATSNRFRAWLTSWTALEILITTRFSRYEEVFLAALRADRTDAVTQH